MRLNVHIGKADDPGLMVGSFFAAERSFHHGTGFFTDLIYQATSLRTIAGIIAGTIVCARAGTHITLPGGYPAELWRAWLTLEGDEITTLRSMVGKSLLQMVVMMLEAHMQVDSITL